MPVLIQGREVLASGTVVLGEADHEVILTLEDTTKIIFRFSEKPGDALDVSASITGPTEVLIDIDDGKAMSGFTYGFTAKSHDGSGLVVDLYVHPIGEATRTRQLSYTLTRLPQ